MFGQPFRTGFLRACNMNSVSWSDISCDLLGVGELGSAGFLIDEQRVENPFRYKIQAKIHIDTNVCASFLLIALNRSTREEVPASNRSSIG